MYVIGTSVVPHEGTWIEIVSKVCEEGTYSSFPTRERGLKSFRSSYDTWMPAVVPHEGTWIEIPISYLSAGGRGVVPHEGTWIEMLEQWQTYLESGVVPHEGTWIEMSNLSLYSPDNPVVPHEGTWIEIQVDGELGNALSVVPHEGTWIEITGVVGGDVTAVSFPTRERGLKFPVPAKDGDIECRSPRGNVD